MRLEISNMSERSKYTRVLNTPGLRKCHGSQYTTGSEYVSVLDAPRF